MKKTRAEGNATAKTGSIANVRCLSGYVRTRDGEILAFSILANNFTDPAATVNWIADLAVERLADFTGSRSSRGRVGTRDRSSISHRRRSLLSSTPRSDQRAAGFALDVVVGVGGRLPERGNRGLCLRAVSGQGDRRRLPHRGFLVAQRLDQPGNFLLRVVADDTEIGDGDLANAGFRIVERIEESGNDDLRIDARRARAACPASAALRAGPRSRRTLSASRSGATAAAPMKLSASAASGAKSGCAAGLAMSGMASSGADAEDRRWP